MAQGAAMQGMPEMEGHAAVDCSTVRVALPPELAGWGERSAMTAAKDAAGAGGAMLAIGKGVDARLAHTNEVHYAMQPEKPGGSVSYGGLFSFTVSEAGTYRVALGSGAWIDLVKDGAAVRSTSHGHGPECSGVRKMVDFALTPGTYVLQLSANGSETLPLLIAKLP